MTTRRDELADRIASMLESAAFSGQSLDSDAAAGYIAQARALLAEMRELADR